MTSGLPNYAEFSYPGIVAYESFHIDDISGIQPSIGSLKCFPQYGLPDENGDIVLTYTSQQFGLQTIVFKNCHIDSAYYEAGSGGQVVNVKFLDERWAWKDTSITGRYNFRLTNNWVDPNHEQTPQKLATLCFQALGVTNFDVNDLPNESRPEVDWDRANPAQELDKICNGLGCRIVPVRSIGAWKIVVTGVGADLPTQYPYQDAGQGIDPRETPDYIKVVTAPVRYQVSLPLGPRGKDFDLSYRTLDKLSYGPNSSENSPFGNDHETFQELATRLIQWPDGTYATGEKRFVLPDGTKVSAMELANDSIFRCWGLDFVRKPDCKQMPNGEWGITIPNIDGYVGVRQIMMTDKLVQTYTDYLGAEHERASYVFGQFFGEKVASVKDGNYPYGTRLDKQHHVSNDNEDERSSFSLSLDPIDNYRSMIVTSSKMVILIKPDAKNKYNYFTAAKLNYMCAVQVRDPATWQPYRYEYFYQIGNGTNKDFCRVVQKDDILPYVIAGYDYSPFGSTNLNGKNSDNQAEVDQECLYYAQSIAREYATVTSQTRTYIGLFPIDLDGAIQQVSYEIGRGGHSTIASQGTEHSWITPSHLERRQQVARQGIAEKVEYAKYENARRGALKGTVNT